MRRDGTGKGMADDEFPAAPSVPLFDVRAGEAGGCRLGEFGRGLSLYLGDEVDGFARI